jgi:hypothetical protein
MKALPPEPRLTTADLLRLAREHPQWARAIYAALARARQELELEDDLRHRRLAAAGSHGPSAQPQEASA